MLIGGRFPGLTGPPRGSLPAPRPLESRQVGKLEVDREVMQQNRTGVEIHLQPPKRRRIQVLRNCDLGSR